MSEIEQKDQTEAAAAEQQRDYRLAVYLHQTFTTIVHGILATIPGEPAEKVLVASARIFGSIIGAQYRGKPEGVRALRAACSSEFIRGMEEQQIQPLDMEKAA